MLATYLIANLITTSSSSNNPSLFLFVLFYLINYIIMKNFIVFLLITKFLLLLVEASDATSQNEQQATTGQDLSAKLDKILLIIEDLDSKYDQLNRTINERLSNKLCNNPAKSTQDYRNDIRSDHPNDILSARDYLHLNANNNNNNNYNKYGPDIHPLSSKLANLNTSSQQHSNNHSCSYIANSIDDMANIFKDQLMNFRSSLNKLLARVWDQTYQFNVMSNQLNLIKDECSLSVTMQTAFKDQQQQQLEQCRLIPQEPGAANPIDPDDLNAMRASQMVAIESIVSRGLTDLSSKVEIIANKVTSSNDKMDELGSVVKQSALILSNLDRQDHKNAPISGNSPKIVYEQLQPHNSFVTVDYYNNNNERVNSNNNNVSNQLLSEIERIATNISLNGNNGNKDSTRWFPGSKIPNQIAPKITNSNTSIGTGSSWCKSKTSVIKPSSCQELRLAGANCTGQYYVFVQGEITHVYCDMNMDSSDSGGGWTVILRRIDKSNFQVQNSTANIRHQRQSANQLLEATKAQQTNFNLNLENYKRGFGQLNEWAEFFIGFDLLKHLLDYNVDSELQIDLQTNNSHHLHIKFDEFSLGDESSHYELKKLGSCNQTESICKPISSLEGLKFEANNGSSMEVSSWPWWRNTKSQNEFGSDLELTQPIGRIPINGTQSHFWYWPGWEHSNEPISRLSMKIRRKIK